jgi:iron complex outermembrane receptor protein
VNIRITELTEEDLLFLPLHNFLQVSSFWENIIMSERSIFQGGIRYDFAQVNAKEYLDWFPSPVINNSDTSYQYLIRSENLDRSFSNTTWSAGYTFNLRGGH